MSDTEQEQEPHQASEGEEDEGCAPTGAFEEEERLREARQREEPQQGFKVTLSCARRQTDGPHQTLTPPARLCLL